MKNLPYKLLLNNSEIKDILIHYKKVVSSHCPTRGAQLSFCPFNLFTSTSAFWCFFFPPACFTADRRHASKKRPKIQATYTTPNQQTHTHRNIIWITKQEETIAEILSSTFSMINYTWHSPLESWHLTCTWNGKQWELLGYADFLTANTGEEIKDMLLISLWAKGQQNNYTACKTYLNS